MGNKVNPQPKAETMDVLRTKLALPRLRASTVPRESLLARLDAGLERRLTLLSAPAGFGKTTLVGEWAAQLNQRYDTPSVAWLSLDKGDNDPARFWRYVIAACQTFDPAMGVAALRQLQTMRAPAFELILTNLINDLTTLNGRCVLVLEDYHLIHAQSIHEAMIYLLDHLPAALHLVIMTRSNPPFPLARLRARDELNELHATDLRLSPAETQSFLQQIIPFVLSAEAVQRLEAHTEGWVAGLQIAALALQGRHDQAGIEAFLESFSGSNRHILDYLATEVLEAQPAPIQEFLLETSFFTRLNADLCNTVTGRQDSAAVLETLERANLFLMPLDGSQQWYRYHALFAEAMQHYAQRHLDPARLETLYHRASLWYEQHDFFHEAVEIALTAKDFERAAVVIERLFELRRYGYQIYTLRRWVETCPADIFPAHPLLALLHAMAILFSSDRYAPSTKIEVEKPLQIAEKSWRELGSQWGLGAVLALRSMAAFWQGDMQEVAITAGESLELLPEDEHVWRAISMGNIAMAELMAGNIQTARTATQQSLAMFESAENPYGSRAMIFVQGEIALQEGDLQQAAQFYRRIIAEAGDDLSDRGGGLYRMASLAYEWNDLESADAYVNEVLDITQHFNDIPLKIRTSLVLAQIQAARGDLAGARETTNALMPLVQWVLLRREVLAMQTRLALKAGDLAAVQRWYAHTAQNGEPIVHTQCEQEAFLAARMLIREDRNEDALRLLDQWQTDAHAMGRTGSEIEIQMLKALAHNAQGQQSQAKRALLEALRMTQAGGYQRLFLSEGETLAALLKATLLEVDEDALITYIRGLLYAFTRESADPFATSTALPTSLSPQEQRVLHLLAAGLSYPQMAEELVVSVNTIKTQVKSIYRKLNVDNRDEARDLAQHLKLI